MQVKPSSHDCLEEIVKIESMEKIKPFICGNSLSEHQTLFDRDDVHYLTIFDNSEVVGFILCVVEPQNSQVELRRIAITKPGKGFGKKAIKYLETYVLDQFFVKKIWLDVYQNNQVGIQLYEQLGYTFTGEKQEIGEDTLLIMSKQLDISVDKKQ